MMTEEDAISVLCACHGLLTRIEDSGKGIYRIYEHLGSEFLFEMLWLCDECHARLSH